MQVLECEDDLGNVEPHFALLEPLSLVKVGEQLPPTHIICKIPIVIITIIIILSLTKDKMKFGWCLKSVVHGDEERRLVDFLKHLQTHVQSIKDGELS